MSEKLENCEIEIRNEQNEKIKQIKNELDRWKNMNSELQRQVEVSTNELVTLKKAIPEQQKQIDSQKTEIDELKSTLLLVNQLKNDLDTLKNTTVPELQQQIDCQKTEINNLKSNRVPIGFIYVQLWGQSEPETLWPNTEWQNISPNYAGLFFRAEGGKSVEFGKTQGQQNPYFETISNYSNNNYVWKAWKMNGAWENPEYLYTGGSAGPGVGIKIKLGNMEICPRNQTIRIWQRVK